MDLTLKRLSKEKSGIFGVLMGPDGHIAVTLEHAFNLGTESDPVFEPKVKSGVYRCVRGLHRLEPTAIHPIQEPFETFELEEVPDFDGRKVSRILIHKGNYNDDSNGCILVGTKKIPHPCGFMIGESQIAFSRFLQLQNGVNQFTLTIADGD